jgi:hypothetical protein
LPDAAAAVADTEGLLGTGVGLPPLSSPPPPSLLTVGVRVGVRDLVPLGADVDTRDGVADSDTPASEPLLQAQRVRQTQP